MNLDTKQTKENLTHDDDNDNERKTGKSELTNKNEEANLPTAICFFFSGYMDQ